MNSSSTGILRKPSQQHQQLWVPSAQGKEIYLDVFRQILEQTYLHASTTDFPAQVLILFLKQRSGLSEEMVNLIWQISDSKNRGALNFDEFCICCRLISIAQSGKIPSSETLQSTSWMPLDYPKIQGVQINDAIIQRNSSVGSGSMSTSASGMASEFIISQTLRAQYLNVYNNTLYPVNNKVHVKTLQNYILQQPNVEPLMCKRILEMCKIALDYMNEYDEDEAIAALHLTSLVSKKAKSGTFDLPINLPRKL